MRRNVLGTGSICLAGYFRGVCGFACKTVVQSTDFCWVFYDWKRTRLKAVLPNTSQIRPPWRLKFLEHLASLW
jgi:hypothetical protein